MARQRWWLGTCIQWPARWLLFRLIPAWLSSVWRLASARAAQGAPPGSPGLRRLRRSGLLLGATLPTVLLGLAAASPSPLAITINSTTGTYPGAPRSVQILDVTLPSGQHIWFDRDLCRTFAWKDTDNSTLLAAPVGASARWPVPDITVYRNYPSPYSDQLGGLW